MNSNVNNMVIKHSSCVIFLGIDIYESMKWCIRITFITK